MKLTKISSLLFLLCSVSAYAGTSDATISPNKSIQPSISNVSPCVEEALSADDRAIYFGFEGGITAPPVKKLKHKQGDIFLKKSSLYNGRIGYSFYPGMSIEFTATAHPKYKLSYVLKPTASLPVPLRDKTKITKRVFMINLIYDLASFDCGIKPYVLGGAGIVRLGVAKTHIDHPQKPGFTVFEVYKSKKNCPSWQIGLGLTKEITPNILFDVSAKLQVLHKATIKYAKFDPAQRRLVRDKISNTAAFGEYTAGLIFKIPLKN